MDMRILCLATAVLAAGAPPASAQSLRRVSIGVTTGISGFDMDRDFAQLEFIVAYRMNPLWVFPNGWNVGFRPGGGFAVLRGHGQTGILAVTRPVLAIGDRERRFLFEVASGPVLIYPTIYRKRSFGGPVQFVSRIGVCVKPALNLTFGCHLQHMSNADIYEQNRGLNTRCLEIRYGL
jgi:hypothetical protein